MDFPMDLGFFSVCSINVLYKVTVLLILNFTKAVLSKTTEAIFFHRMVSYAPKKILLIWKPIAKKGTQTVTSFSVHTVPLKSGDHYMVFSEIIYLQIFERHC